MISEKINSFLNNFNITVVKIFPRHSIRFAKEHFGNKKIVAVEVGVRKGDNSMSMLKELNIRRMFLIDIKKCFDFVNDNMIFFEMQSDDAVYEIPMCNFIYIDGDHSYQQAKRDMINYWEKVKTGGILAGHDIAGENRGVAQAFVEFCYEYKLKPYITRTDWWVVKE